MKNKIALIYTAISDRWRKQKETIQFKVFIQLLIWLAYWLCYGMVAIMMTAKDDLMVICGLIMGMVLLILIISRLCSYIKWIVKKIDEQE